MTATRHRYAGAIALGCLLAAGATAQSPFTRALPADTIGLFEFPDITRSLEKMQNAPIARMWHEQEVQDFLADAIGMFEAKWAEGIEQGKAMHEMGELPFDPEELTKLRVHSLGVAMTSLDIESVDAPGLDGPMPTFGVIAHADLGDSAPIWRKLIDAGLHKALEESDGEIELSADIVAENHVKRIRSSEFELPMSFNLAFVGNSIVFGTIEAEVDAFVTALQSGESRLAGSRVFLDNSRHLDKDAESRVYIRPGGLIDFGMRALKIAQAEVPDFPPELDVAGVERVIEALGLRSIETIGSTSAYRGSRCVGSSFVASPEQSRTGMMALELPEVDMTALRWVPKDAASVAIGTFDASAIYNGIVGAIKAYDENVAMMLLGRLGQLEEQFGVSLSEDIFGAFGKRYVYWELPMASFTSLPEMAIIVEMKNQEGFLKALGKAAEMSEGKFQLEKNERRGITVYQIVLDLDVGGGGGGFNPFATFTPTFSFKDGFLVFASSTGDIKRAFKRMEREDDASGDIRSNPEFSPYLQEIPSAGLVSLSFSDWKAKFESYYQIGTTFLAFIPLDDEIPIDLSLLPDSSTLTQHLCGSVAWSRMTEAGIESKSIGPWGPETMALLGVGLVGGGAALAVSEAGF